MENKVTRVMNYNDLAALAAEAGRQDLVEFCNHQVELLDAKKAKAQEKAAEKKKAGDELQARILDVLTDTPQSKDDICAVINDPEVTPAKIVSRMKNLVDFGFAVKDTAKTEDGKKVTVYTLGTPAEADAE